MCNHARAIPMAPWIIRWGADAPAKMRANFRCAACGRVGCTFDRPRPDYQGANGMLDWNPELFPAGREVHMAGERKTGESRPEAALRVRAEYLARYRCGDAIRSVDGMCNLYSMTKGQQAIRELVKAMRDTTSNLPSLPAVFPNRMAPVVRTAPDGMRELTMMRWGFPPPSIPGQKPRNPHLTNVRNTQSRYWKTYLKEPAKRCLVPATSFAEPDNNQGPKSIWTWFAQDESRPLIFFAGIWRQWQGANLMWAGIWFSAS